MTISSIVEGDGEVEAVPILLRRIVGSVRTDLPLLAPRPIRLSRGKITKETEFSRALQLARLTLKGDDGGIFVLMDADDDCPAELGPRLKKIAEAVVPQIRVAVVIAKAEYESWFLAAALSIAGRRGLSANLVPPDDPESIRAAKGWLDRHMPLNRCYRETLDQPALTSLFDLVAARTAPSFDKCYREVMKIIEVD